MSFWSEFWYNAKAILFQGWWWKDRAEEVGKSTWIMVGLVVVIVVILVFAPGIILIPLKRAIRKR